MSLPTWTVILLVLVHLVKVPAVLYLARRSNTSGGGTTDRNDSEHYRPAANHGTGDRDTCLCDACGAENDPSFQYCRECATPIGNAGTGSPPA